MGIVDKVLLAIVLVGSPIAFTIGLLFVVMMHERDIKKRTQNK